MRALCIAFAVAPLVLAAPARAGGLNDYSCKPASAHPHPVVLVHGQGSTVEMFQDLGIVTTLVAQGHCVFGISHGEDESGRHGRAHLAESANQIEAFIDDVLKATGAAQVDVISHSAGTGVVANLILAKHRGKAIDRVISFGGLHHPYAHVDAGVDTNLFVPNLVVTARMVDPNITAQQVIATTLDAYTTAGGPLFGIDAELAKSDFVADLFEPTYWTALHGALSEPPGRHLVPGQNARTLQTEDADPSVCYTNIVGAADPLTGASAGFQDAAPNVDNFLLETGADHVQILTDPMAQTKMLAALKTACAEQAPGGGTDDGDEDGTGGGDDGEGGGFTAGCTATRGGSATWFALLGLLGAACRRRRRERDS